MNKRIFFIQQSFSQYLILIALCISFFSCKDSSDNQPDVSSVKVQLNTRRLDKELKALDTNHLAEGLVQLQKQYPDFLNFYLDTLMGFNINGNYVAEHKGISEGLHSFLTFRDYSDLFDTVAVHYPNTDDVDKDLIKGFQYLQHYYPSYKIPKVVYFVSGLSNWGVVSYDGVLGIGLDMFLGEKYPFYAAVGQPDYMYINFRKESIAPSVFSTIYNDFHPFQDEERTLLDMMIQKGKQQYFVERMLPFVPLEDRIGYTKAQLDWCAENEAIIYNFFLNKNLMFEKNWGVMRRFVVYGPNTSGMPPESPGNIGTWLGLQIVKAFAKEHPEMDMQQMFRDEDAAQFLKKSKYKPKK